MRHYRNEAVELLAEARLGELERVLGASLAPPVPIDLLAEQVQVLQALLRDPAGVELIRDLTSRADDPAEARAVNRYAAAISMPREMMRGLVAENRPTRWPELYRLAERFEVTISALKVRLEQLGLLHVAPDGRIYPSREEAAGQLRMW